ncbi:hypothetical protein ACFRCI_16190 [Streptomyces sp. NPDC056638]|uniref:hypothetical protein n=1 Tax=Streptomyces sp. NPDC056638 TaxID=3345887 RepID=UPI003685374F
MAERKEVKGMHAVLLVLLAAAAWAAWHWSRYPGNWVFAFSAKHGKERADLEGLQRELRDLDKGAARVERSAREWVSSEEVKYREDTQALEREVENLLSPGLGRLLKGPVGDLTLYEHGVVVADRTTPIPLAGLRVEFELEPVCCIDLVEPGLRTYRTKYPRFLAPKGEGTPFFSAEQLSDFAVRIPPVQAAPADERPVGNTIHDRPCPGALLRHLPASRDELLGAHAFALRWRVPVAQHVGAAVQCEEVVRIRVFECTQSKASGVQRGDGQRHTHVPSPDRWPINQTSDAGHSQWVFSAGWQGVVFAAGPALAQEPHGVHADGADHSRRQTRTDSAERSQLLASVHRSITPDPGTFRSRRSGRRRRAGSRR